MRDALGAVERERLELRNRGADSGARAAEPIRLDELVRRPPHVKHSRVFVAEDRVGGRNRRFAVGEPS